MLRNNISCLAALLWRVGTKNSHWVALHMKTRIAAAKEGQED